MGVQADGPGAGAGRRHSTAMSGRPWRCSSGTWRRSHRISADAEAAKAGRGDVHTRAEGGRGRQVVRGRSGRAGQYLGSVAQCPEGWFPKHRSSIAGIRTVGAGALQLAGGQPTLSQTPGAHEVPRMKCRVEVICLHDDGEQRCSVMEMERAELAMETLGLSV